MKTKLKRGTDRILLLAGAGLVVATLIVLLTTGVGAGTSPSGGESAAQVDKVPIKDFKFLPADITVPAGTKITWTNADAAPHTATSGESSPDGAFNTKTIKKGRSASVTLKKPGTFVYFCKFHKFMKGTVTVT